MEMAIYITKSRRLAPSEKLHKKMDAVSLAFFNVYANLNVNKVDKEHHTSMESCMKPQKVMPAYHDAFSKETDPQLLNLDALPQNMRDAGLLLLNVYWLWVIEF